ncbi:MAG TPA: trypsin-like peptidase domain-containing protein, partial [Acidimicrobiales bacterium]
MPGLWLALIVIAAAPAAIASARSASPPSADTRNEGGIVDIVTSLGYERASAAGTGQVLTATGEILTNNHVIRGATTISVTDVGNGRTYSATVVGYDPSHDIAVLQLTGAAGLQTATLGDSSKATVGEGVIGIGNAGGSGGTPTSAGGSITALDQSIAAADRFAGAAEQLSGLIEVNAPVQSGDSGGPLVDGQGRVIGMDTAGSAGFVLSSTDNQAYAIPINEALATASQIEAGHSSVTIHVGPTAFLGVTVA